MRSRRAVYVVDAALQDGPITDRPTATLAQQCVEAGRKLVGHDASLRSGIEAVYFGTMGVFRGVARARLAPAHIPNHLRRELGLDGLRGSGYHTYLSTSESGAVALIKAVQDLEEGRFETVLVVAGEQMFSLEPAQRAEDRADIAHWIRSVVDPVEADRYGLSMPWIGNLLFDHQLWHSGLPRTLWRDVIEASTLDKYGWSQLYPATMQGAKELAQPGATVTAARYRDDARNPWVTPHFRRDDLCANANGATAIVLSTAPAVVGRARRKVRIAGMGEGHTSVALAGRGGPFSRPSSIRRALRELCSHAAIDPAILWDDRPGAPTAGIYHDAFPSIELAFLGELARLAEPVEADRWRWVCERFVRSWSNPLGGLCASGHALGNSGLFQVAKAFHSLCRDARYLRLDDPALAPYVAAMGARQYLVTSVGSALTNIIATLLVDEDDLASRERLAEAQRRHAPGEVAHAFGREDADARFSAVTCAEGEGVVLGATRVRAESGPAWVYLVQASTGTRLALDATEAAESLAVGTLVELVERGERTEIARARGCAVPAPVAEPAVERAVRAAVDAARGGRLRCRFA